MIHLFISYGGKDREIARLLADRIHDTFEGKIETRIIEDETPYDGKTWKEKVLEYLKKTSIFVILFSRHSKNRQWPNQELGYAYALLERKGIKLIPVVEVIKWDGELPQYISLDGFITRDMDKIPLDLNDLDKTIERIINKLKTINLIELARKVHPSLSSLEDNDQKVLEFILKKRYTNERNYALVHKKEILDEIPGMSEETLEETLMLLENMQLIQEEDRSRYRITSEAFLDYAPILLDINPQKDLDIIIDFIASYKDDKYACTGKVIRDTTKIHPNVIEIIVELLERQGLIKVTRGIGSPAPFNFFSVKITPLGRRIAKKKNLQKTNTNHSISSPKRTEDIIYKAIPTEYQKMITEYRFENDRYKVRLIPGIPEKEKIEFNDVIWNTVRQMNIHIANIEYL